jgi:hypothetical protein
MSNHVGKLAAVPPLGHVKSTTSTNPTQFMGVDQPVEGRSPRAFNQKSVAVAYRVRVRAPRRIVAISKLRCEEKPPKALQTVVRAGYDIDPDPWIRDC